MRNRILIFISLILFFSVSCHNQYYLKEGSYKDDGRAYGGILEFVGDFNADDYHYDWTNKTSHHLKPIKELKLEISLECDKYLHFYVTDQNKARWEPIKPSDQYTEYIKTCTREKTLKDFGLEINEDPEKPFYVSLTNKESGELIFTTENTDFVYTDVFIGFAGLFSSNDVYGFGERYHQLKLGDGKFTMWPNDTTGIHEDTGEGGHNAMSMHPLGFHRSAKHSFVGLLFNNINCQDLVIKSNYAEGNNHVLLEHRTLGGVIDYYITVNDSPDKALKTIHDVIGHPTLPPYWAVGFHQCRWGYNTEVDMRYVYQNFTKNELPVDTFWGDIDVLQDYRIFTLNKPRFSGLPDLIKEFHEKNYFQIFMLKLELIYGNMEWKLIINQLNMMASG